MDVDRSRPAPLGDPRGTPALGIPRCALPLASGIVLGLFGGLLGGCLDLALVGDVAFPPAVPGLPPDQPWTALPIRSWVTEGEVEGKAIAACFQPGCPTEAAVAVFRARGAAADLLLAQARQPDGLLRALRSQPGRRTGKGPPPARSEVAAERLREENAAGFLLRLAGGRTPRQAFGVALASPRGAGAAIVIVVVAGTEEAARRIAHGVAGGLG